MKNNSLYIGLSGMGKDQFKKIVSDVFYKHDKKDCTKIKCPESIIINIEEPVDGKNKNV